MKKSIYQFYTEISEGLFLHYCSITNSFLLLKEGYHRLYENTDADKLKFCDEAFYRELIKKRFIIRNSTDELKYVLDRKKEFIFNENLYNVVVNTTLDCNLNCWYCYKNRVKGSKLQPSVIDAIKKNIKLKYKERPFKILKLSFFGGEPFLYFEGIKNLLDFAKDFCKNNNVELIADFTTNATLITFEHVEYLKHFRCHFQITLDGGHVSHNLVKRNKSIDTYAKTLESLSLINDNIRERFIAVRINFDNNTLLEIDEIIKDINFLDRIKSYVILKKVWQLSTDRINKDALLGAIQNLIDNKFLVDYYIMPKGCVCFAERENEVLFNYDGEVFKCTTISSFTNENTLGKLDFSTGHVEWNTDKIYDWFRDMQPEYCKKCKWFPACLGICNNQIMANKGHKICTFDSFNLTEKEYLMYLFKYNILQKELYGEELK